MRLVRPLMIALLALEVMMAMSGGTAAADVPRIQGALTIFTAASLTDITKASADRLKLAPGKEVYAVIKASDVMIATA